MATNEELVYEIQQAKAAKDLDKVDRLGKLLYDSNKGLIFSISNKLKDKYARSIEDQEDIDGEAKKAFCAAVLTFNPTKGSFATWASDHVKYAIYEWTRNNTRIMIPDGLKKLVHAFDSIVEEYKNKNNGKNPSDKYILIELNKNNKVDEARLGDIRAAKITRNFICLNESINRRGTMAEEVIDRMDISMEIASIEDSIIICDEQRRVMALIKQLPEVEFKVLYGRFYEDKMLNELAQELGYKHKQDIEKVLHRAYVHLLKIQEIIDIGEDNGWLHEN